MISNSSRYSKKFKVDAVKMVNEEGRYVCSVAYDLGIKNRTLRNRTNRYKREQDTLKLKVEELEHELSIKQKKVVNFMMRLIY